MLNALVLSSFNRLTVKVRLLKPKVLLYFFTFLGFLLSASDSWAKFALSLGYTLIKYTETQTSDLTERVLTLKVSESISLGKSDWLIGFGGYYTASVLYASKQEQARFLGVNLKTGYSSKKKRKFHLDPYIGAYYATMMVDSSSYGFRNMSGPQINLVLRQSFAKNNGFQLTLKSALVSRNIGQFSLLNRELGVGLSYVQPLSKKDKFGLSLALDWARIQMVITGVSIRSNSYSASFGVSF